MIKGKEKMTGKPVDHKIRRESSQKLAPYFGEYMKKTFDTLPKSAQEADMRQAYMCGEYQPQHTQRADTVPLLPPKKFIHTKKEEPTPPTTAPHDNSIPQTRGSHDTSTTLKQILVGLCLMGSALILGWCSSNNRQSSQQSVKAQKISSHNDVKPTQLHQRSLP